MYLQLREFADWADDPFVELSVASARGMPFAASAGDVLAIDVDGHLPGDVGLGSILSEALELATGAERAFEIRRPRRPRRPVATTWYGWFATDFMLLWQRYRALSEHRSGDTSVIRTSISEA